MGDYSMLADNVRCYNVNLIVLHEHALVSQGAYLCCASHNIDESSFALISKPITLGPSCWIASEAFVGPGVNIGEGAVLGARGVAFRDLQPWTINVGNPAVEMRMRLRGNN